MTIIVSALYSRRIDAGWQVVAHCKDLDAAIAVASRTFADKIPDNAYVQVKLEQVKR